MFIELNLAQPCEVFEFISPLLDKLPEADGKKCAETIQKLHNPLTCWQTFLETACEQDAVQEDDDTKKEDAAKDEAANPDISPLDSIKANFNKATGSLLELLLGLMRGKNLEDCKTISKAGDAISKVVLSASGSAGSKTNSESEQTELVKELCVILQSFETSGKSVSLSSSAPAATLISTLTSGPSSGDDDAAREKAWKQVQSERRKYVTFSTPKTLTKDGIQNAFRGCGKVSQHSGHLNSSHRLFVASADLMTESTKEPWLEAAFSESSWRDVADFCASTSGPTDFVVLFDGRMRQPRKIIAPCLCLSYSAFLLAIFLSFQLI